MKLLTIKLGEKTYTSGKITTYLTREALKLQRDALKLGETAKKMVENINETDAQEILEALDGLLSRKVWLICEVYGNRFTADELERTLDSEEIDQEVNRIIRTASGVIEKN
jgi:23S rRNA pseudoU1915 N3-methylase RlmH